MTPPTAWQGEPLHGGSFRFLIAAYDGRFGAPEHPPHASRRLEIIEQPIE
jgi:hypothetical protein